MSTKPKRTGNKKPRGGVKLAGSTDSAPLLADLRDLILTARRGVARAVDSGLVVLSWQIGQRIRRDILREKRAEYGKAIVVSLGRQLEREFGRGFSAKALIRSDRTDRDYRFRTLYR